MKFALHALCSVLLITALAACSSNPHKAEEIETKVENSTPVSGEEVGIKDGNLVVQRKSLMSEELRRLQHEVYGIEDHVYGNAKYGSRGLYGVLKDCRKELSDKANGGTGKLIWTEPIERLTDKEEQYKIGLDEENKVVGVTEEFLKDRITRFQEYKRILMKRQEEYEDKVDVCKAELRSRKHDLKKQQVTQEETVQ